MTWPKLRFRTQMVGLGLLAVAGPAPANWQVWTEVHTVRVNRETPAGTNRVVQLAAARNEWEGFQVLMRADKPVQGIQLEPAPLQGPGGAVIEPAQMRLYRQHQLHLTNGTYRNDQFQPGWYPDPLTQILHLGRRVGVSLGDS